VVEYIKSRTPRGLKLEVELKTVYFEHSGREATEATLQIARRRAEELGIKKVIVASTTGDTAVRAMEVLKGLRVIAVSHVTGMREPNVQEFTEKNRKLVESKGGTILTAAHAFSGLSAAMRQKFNTYVIGDIVAATLRIFGQGMKVACEIALMAADSGLVRTDEDVISVAGTGHGADTALLLTPVISRNFFDLKVKEVLCKPRL
jgi:hypothetical protein